MDIPTTTGHSVPACCRAAPPPGDADPEWAQYVAWADREAAAGRVPSPSPGIPGTGSRGRRSRTARSLRPGLAGRCAAGPERPLFAEGGAADVMPPSPFLAALTEQAAGDVSGLSDSELVGVLRATQRQVAREQYKQALAAAEFGRRRQAAFSDALAPRGARRVRGGRVPRRGTRRRAGDQPRRGRAPDRRRGST